MHLEENGMTSGRVKKKSNKGLSAARRTGSGGLEQLNMEWHQDQGDDMDDKDGDGLGNKTYCDCVMLILNLGTVKYDNRSRAAVRLEKRRNLIKEKIDYIRECLAPDDTPQSLSQANTLQLAAKFIVDNEHVLEEFKQSIADEMPERAMGDLLMMLDKDSNITLTLQNATEYLEEDADSLKGRSFLDLVHTTDRERVSTAMAEGGDIYQYDVRVQPVSYNDTDHIMLSAMRAFKCHKLDDGKVLGDGHESSYTAWVICEPDGTISHAGSSADDSNVFGYPSDSLVGQSYYKGIHPEDISTVAKMHTLIVRAAQSSYLYYRAQTKGGFWVLVDALAVPCINRTTTIVECYVVEMRCTETNTHIPKPAALHRNGAQAFLPITYDDMDSLLAKCEMLAPKREDQEGVVAETNQQQHSAVVKKGSGVVVDRKDSFKLTGVFGLTRVAVTTDRTRGVRAGGRRPAGLSSLIVPPAPALPTHPSVGANGDGTPVANNNNTPRRNTVGSVTDLQFQQMQALQATADTLTNGPSSLGTGVQVGLPGGPLSGRQYPAFVTPRPQPLHHAPYRLDRGGNAGAGVFSQHSTPTATTAAAAFMVQLQQQQQQQLMHQHLTSPFGIPEMLSQMALISPHYRAMLANLTPRGGVSVAGGGVTAFNVEQQLALQQGLGGMGMDQAAPFGGMGHINLAPPHITPQMGMGGVGMPLASPVFTAPTPSPRNNVVMNTMGNVMGMMPNVSSQGMLGHLHTLPQAHTHQHPSLTFVPPRQLPVMSSAPLLGAAHPHINTGTLDASPHLNMMGQKMGAMGLSPMGPNLQSVSSFHSMHSMIENNPIPVVSVGNLSHHTPRGYNMAQVGVGGVNHIPDVQSNIGMSLDNTRPLPVPNMHSAPATLSLPDSTSTMNTNSFGDMSAGVPGVGMGDVHVPPLELGDLGDHHHVDLHDFVLGHENENTQTNGDSDMVTLGEIAADMGGTALEMLGHEDDDNDNNI